MGPKKEISIKARDSVSGFLGRMLRSMPVMIVLRHAICSSDGSSSCQANQVVFHRGCGVNRGDQQESAARWTVASPSLSQSARAVRQGDESETKLPRRARDVSEAG